MISLKITINHNVKYMKKIITLSILFLSISALATEQFDGRRSINEDAISNQQVAQLKAQKIIEGDELPWAKTPAVAGPTTALEPQVESQDLAPAAANVNAVVDPNNPAAPAVQADVVEAPKGQNNISRFKFDKEQYELNEAQKADILANLIPLVKADATTRYIIKSYASKIDAKANSARRVSLQRATKLREFLIQNGIDVTRFNVQSLGEEGNKLDLDFIDVEKI
jgi:outer membrane protein OmpA-like peptidoglycan-associated protein